jgi:hypothetical protein
VVSYTLSNEVPNHFIYMGPRFTCFLPAPTLALLVAVVGCSPLKSTAKAVPQDAADDTKLHGDGGPPVSSATGGNSGRGGRPGWSDEEPAGVGGMQGSGSGGGGSGGTMNNEDGGPNGSTGGQTGLGGTVGNGNGGTTGTGGTGGSSAGGGMVGSGTGGASNTGGRGGSSGTGTGGIEIPNNNNTGTGGSPGSEVFVPPPANDVCANAPALPMKLGHMDLPVDTRGASASLAASCGPAGPDVFFSFNLIGKQAVYADTFGSNWNTMVFFAKTCDGPPLTIGGPQACNDDACGTMQSQAVAILPAGKYYLVISGAQGQSGPATVHFEHTPLGNGPTEALAAGTSTLTGTTSGAGALEFCEAGAADNSYWWATCPSFVAAPFTAGTCDLTKFDSVLSLQMPRAGLAFCNDDACGFQSRVSANVPKGAGLNVLSVDGSTGRQAGAYSMTVTRP